MQFDINAAAALLGYITLLVGFAVLGSAGLAFIQSIPARLRLRSQQDEPSYFRVQRVRPQDFFYELGPDGRITDAVELNEDHTAVVAEYHERPQPDEYKLYAEAVRRNGADIAPHCDSEVLHRPGACQYCDHRPDLQEFRLLHGINFTGENDPAKLSCPAAAKRSVETIERWGGNRARAADWLPEIEDAPNVCD